MEGNIKFEKGVWTIPDNPTVGYIVGDGIGLDVTPVAMKVLDAAVAKTYPERKIDWQEVVIGEKALEKMGEHMPQSELDKIKDFRMVLKGPLTTPVGKGFRSLNVAIRQIFDLYSCIRPVRYFKGLPAPVKRPELVDVVIFRENTEDVYAGIEWKAESQDANDLIKFVKDKGMNIREKSGIGIKPISAFGSQRLVRAAMEWALAKKRKTLTLVHKGNIMKFTEGAFKEWGYEMLRSEYPDKILIEDDGGEVTEGKVLVKNRIADAMFQQILLRPDEYDVIATMNLNGDYISDAAAAQVGGLGMAPGANVGDGIAVFEATHGTAPKYTGLDKVNPGSIILSGVMMLELMGWDDAAKLIIEAMEKTFAQKTVTYDLERQMEGAKLLKCSEFGEAIIQNM